TRRLLALLRDEAVGEVLDRLRDRRVRVRDDERLLLVERLAHDLPVRGKLAEDRQVQRVLDPAARHAAGRVGLVRDEQDRLRALGGTWRTWRSAPNCITPSRSATALPCRRRTHAMLSAIIVLPVPPFGE